ncbi:MAG TPA: endonuclease/exonuclease/phosphatase family protein, partial [Allosphingosinicella sp.]|nr:endonuclease/exonuclease/phosphatase family protein [Allosphingosinicella sp.]
LHLPSLEPRGAVMADICLDGEELRVVGMHLDLSGLWRRQQAHSILHHLQTRETEMPAVLMGDLNEWSMRGGCLRDFGHNLTFADCGRSFHVRRPVARLDRIMVTEGLSVEEAGVHKSAAARKASDHYPVWARLKRL